MLDDSSREMANGGNGEGGSKRVEVSGDEEPAGREVSEMEEMVAQCVCVCVRLEVAPNSSRES